MGAFAMHEEIEMSLIQRLCAAVVAVECAFIGVCAYLIGRTYAAVKGRSG
ncbi:hypothetical protein CITRIK5_30032 [Citricoccus sp. K5]|nr:hypothetical protein CITRIK5_30032 [Citricoccus sp. K5]